MRFKTVTDLAFSENFSLKKNFCINAALLLSAALFFAAAFPGLIFADGSAVAAFIAVLPVALLVNRIRLIWQPLCGFFYGAFCYALFNYWTSTYYPLSLLFIVSVIGAYCAVLFFFLRLPLSLRCKFPFLWQIFVWLIYEHCRTIGFLAYPYGIIGYSLYQITPLIQIAEVAGVWPLSLLIVAPAFYLARRRNCADRQKNTASLLKKYAWPFLYTALVIMLLLFGLIRLSQLNLDQYRTLPVAMVQHNNDSWLRGGGTYRQRAETLIRLSRQAIEQHSESRLIIWAETALVPSINYHRRFRLIPQSLATVNLALDFFRKQADYDFLIGNSERKPAVSAVEPRVTVDYNATLHYRGEQQLDYYYKTKLVPVSEYFPYEKELPALYRLLKSYGYAFWQPGDRYTVFETTDAENRNVTFSTPICFEDLFGDLCRRFVGGGANLLVNVGDDFWSQTVAAETQHMTMSIIRAVENRRSLIRATNSGITCYIDPAGNIVASLPPFTEGILAASPVIVDDITTIYSRFGDWLVILLEIVTAVCFLFLMIKKLYDISR